MKSIKIALFILVIIFFNNVLAQDAEQISKKSLDVIKVDEFEMSSTLKIIDNKGNERVRKLITANKKFGKVNKTLIKFVSPADVKGTNILIYNYDDKPADMWIYLPSLRKIRRIAGSEKSSNFMGSEFKNSDMTIPVLNDFNYKLIGNTILNNNECYIIEATPKNTELAKEYGFSKQVSYIDKHNFLTYKTEYYDLSGKLERTQMIYDYRKQKSGNYFAFKMEMTNEKNNRKSILIIDDFKEVCTLSEDKFNSANLDK